MAYSQNNIANEKWETISGYPNYMISSESRVLNKNTLKLKALCYNKRHKFRYVRLHKDNHSVNIPIYRLKAIAFIPNPLNKREVNHLDGDRMNEDLSNLVWATPKENMKHSYDTGLCNGYFKKGFDHQHCKLKKDDIDLIRRLRKDKLLSIYKLAKVFNVNFATISRVAVGRAGNHV